MLMLFINCHFLQTNQMNLTNLTQSFFFAISLLLSILAECSDYESCFQLLYGNISCFFFVFTQSRSLGLSQAYVWYVYFELDNVSLWWWCLLLQCCALKCFLDMSQWEGQLNIVSGSIYCWYEAFAVKWMASQRINAVFLTNSTIIM